MAEDRHVWITGASYAAARVIERYGPDIAVDCHRRLRGPYTGTGSLLRTLVPLVHAEQPGLAKSHAIEILAAAPELGSFTGPVPDTLTSAAFGEERTRWYSRYRTRRIAHGIIDYLRERAAARPMVIAFGSVDEADPTDCEFLALALRRLDAAQVRLVVCARGPDIAGELRDARDTYCIRERAAAPAVTRRTGMQAAAAYVASDGTSDIPGEHEAYLQLSASERTGLHDERAAALAGRDESSLQLGAIPYHLARGSSAAERATPALLTAMTYCVRMASYDAAVELVDQIAALADASGDLLLRFQIDLQRAICLATLGRLDGLEARYHDLLGRSMHARTHANLWYYLAMLHTRYYEADRKDHRRARAYLNTALVIADRLEDRPDRALCLAFMGNAKALVEMHLGDLDAALRLVDQAIQHFNQELQPERHQLHRSVLHHNRAQVLAALGRQEEALTEFGHVIEHDPYYPEYYFDRGNLLSMMGQHQSALADYDRAAALSPPFAEVYYNRGDLRAADGDLDGAIGDLRYVLDLEPDHLEAQVSLASLLLDRGDPLGAAAQASAGLLGMPDEPRLHCTLGLARLELAEPEAAMDSFDRALALDPDMPEALANRAVAAYELSRYDEAVADLTVALRIRSGDPDLLYNRGFALHAAGRPIDAIADYTLALAAEDADRAALLYQRGLSRAALGQDEEARHDLRAHLALGPSPHEQEILDRFNLAAR
jgi:tetratricopeptide (TPR) repeat protein